MAVGANTYATVARVEARVGDLVSGRTFTASTTPTATQVEAICDDVAARLNAELRAHGYTVPVANSGNDVEAYAWLRAANSAGAAAIVLNMIPGQVLDVDNPDPNTNRRNGLWSEMNTILKSIREGQFPASRTVTTELTKAWAGSYQDDEGNTKTPAFTRKVTDWPGVW